MCLLIINKQALVSILHFPSHGDSGHTEGSVYLLRLYHHPNHNEGLVGYCIIKGQLASSQQMSQCAGRAPVYKLQGTWLVSNSLALAKSPRLSKTHLLVFKIKGT